MTEERQLERLKNISGPYAPDLARATSYLPQPIRDWAWEELWVNLRDDLDELGVPEMAGTVGLIDGSWYVVLRVPPDGPLEECFIHEAAHIFAGQVNERLFGDAHAERERRTWALRNEWVREATSR